MKSVILSNKYCTVNTVHVKLLLTEPTTESIQYAIQVTIVHILNISN